VTFGVAASGAGAAAGELRAVGSGDPRDLGSFHATTRRTWRGSAVAIVRAVAGAGPGAVVVTAVAPGVGSGQALLRFE